MDQCQRNGTTCANRRFRRNGLFRVSGAQPRCREHAHRPYRHRHPLCNFILILVRAPLLQAQEAGGHMFDTQLLRRGLPTILLALMALPAAAQSFRVQCPEKTNLHPTAPGSANPMGGQIKCQQISGGDGYATMADGTQTYLFSFGPLSGVNDIANGLPGTQTQAIFMTPFDPSAIYDSTATPLANAPANGAVGLMPDPQAAEDPVCSASSPPSYCTTGLNGHVDARAIMDLGVLNGNIPAPMMAIDEDDEFFLTLTNVGMIMRPDLFEQHTVHFHGYPNASGFYDGVPDASVAINIAGSFTYYYLAPDAGTYFWHCHITPPEHLQMGMVGQLYVRPRQNRVPASGTATPPELRSA